jgi:peroxiredoxin
MNITFARDYSTPPLKRVPLGPGWRLPGCIAALCLLSSLWAPVDALALRVGDPVPRVTMETLAGGTLAIPDAVRGKVTVLHFWSAGCSSCKEEMPALDALYRAYGGKGLAVLAINVGQKRDAVRQFLGTLRVSYPILLDPDRRVASAYEATGVPRTFILDRSGAIRYKIVGEVPEETLKKFLQSLL